MSLSEEKQDLLHIVEDLLKKDYVVNNVEIQESLQELRQDMLNDFFTVVVLGEFKRGKSTFINALIGEELLPTDVLPETATINALMYADVPRLSITNMDGTERKGEPTQEFLKHFSANSKDEDVDNVKYIKIGYPADILKGNVVIVDTPGVSDINEQRCEVTYRFIPKANAVVFLLDANSPLKKTEKDFIDEKLLKYGIENIIFVVNKYDAVDEEEDENFLEELQFTMMKAFSDEENTIKNILLYPLSAKMAINGIVNHNQNMIEYSGIEQVKKTIKKVVHEGRVEEDKLKRYNYRLDNSILMLINKLENTRALKNADIDKLKSTNQKLYDMLARQKESKASIRKYVEKEKSNIIAIINKSLAYFHKRLEERIVDDIEYYKGLDFKDYVEQRISRNLQHEFENWLSSYSPQIERLLLTLEKEISKGMSYKLNQKILLSSNKTDGITKNNFRFDLMATDVSSSNIKAGVISAGGAGLMMLIGSPVLMPLISMAAYPLLQRKILEEQLAAAKEDVIPDIQEQLAICINELRSSIERYVEDRINKIVYNAEESYINVLSSVQEGVEKEIKGKEALEKDMTLDLNSINNTIMELKGILEKKRRI